MGLIQFLQSGLVRSLEENPVSRLLSDLQLPVRLAAEEALKDCHEEGLELLITCTYRTAEEQDALYAQGRTKHGPKVTNAKAGQSMHQYKVALDLYPLVNGKPDFSGKAPEWFKIAAIFKKHGFEWAYEWKRFKEMPHFQMTKGHSLAYFQSGGKL